MKKIDKKTLLTIVLAIAALLVVIIPLFSKNSNKEANKIEILTNYNEFYTVNSCIYRTITYIAASDKSSLLLTVNDEYKSKNNVTEDNILSMFPEVSSQSTFLSKKMYYQKLSDNVKKYYVYGQIEEESYSGLGNTTDEYFIVYLDSSNKTFSIEPYDGEIFIGGDSNE